MATSLITGGAGFIGSHLVEACLARGHRVVVLDDLSSGTKANLPLADPGLVFVHGSVTDSRVLNDIKKHHPDIDFVFHLAAIVSVPRAMADPLRAHTVNFDGTLLLLETFKTLPIRQFVLASSSAVYGDTRTVPVREDFPLKPISTYGADKLLCEHYAGIYNNAFGLPATACRFFNVFGERQDPSSPYSGVLSIFFDRARARARGLDATITIYGDGRQTRDFIYVKDVVGALVFVAEHAGLRGEIFNVGYGRHTSIHDLARTVMRLTGVDMPIIFADPRPGDILHSAADITKITGAGLKFAFDLEDGLKTLAALPV
jgi:UDP-glucose 4-epimerase